MEFIYCILLTLLVVPSGTKAVSVSTQQRKVLDQFRQVLRNENSKEANRSDAFLISRWLKGSNWNLDDSVQRYAEVQKWREDNGIDGILNETILEFSQSPFSLVGQDKKGRLVASLQMVNTREITLQGKGSKLVRYYIQFLERIEEELRSLSKQNGKDVFECVSVTNYGKTNRISNGCLACLQILRQIFQIEERYYSGLFAHDILVNVPPFTKSFLQPLTTGSEHIHIFGKEKEEWLQFLKRLIPEDQLEWVKLF